MRMARGGCRAHVGEVLPSRESRSRTHRPPGVSNPVPVSGIAGYSSLDSARRGKKAASAAGRRAGSPTPLVAAGRFSPMKKVHVNVGTIGHIDHGKTTLTAAILAVQA